MKQKKLIDLYWEWMESGWMPTNGLCNSVPIEYFNSLELFEPTQDDKEELYSSDMSITFWGSGLDVFSHEATKFKAFTPIRQLIVLFICAMHNEL